MCDRFDWSSPSVVLHGCGDVAVYTNPNGDVVIRQECFYGDDPYIVVPIDSAERVAQAILDRAEESRAQAPDGAEQPEPAQETLALPAPTGPRPINGARQRSEAANG